jgi:hypothetical protein
MSGLLATVVDGEELLDTVLAALIGGVGITLIFSLALLGAARATDATREGSPVAAAAYGTLAVLGLLAFFGVIVLGIVVLTAK